MKEIESNKEWLYFVYEAPSGELYVAALTSGHGISIIRARLDDEERAIYRSDPSKYIRIVRRLVRWPEEFRDRIVSEEEWERLTAHPAPGPSSRGA